MRRSAMLLSVLLILTSLAAILPATMPDLIGPSTQTAHQEGGVLGYGPVPFAASGDASLDVIITDDQGLPVLGSSIEVFDGWTDLRVAGPTVVVGSRLVIDDLPAGPMRIHATHTAYASAFSTISLTSGVTNTTIPLVPLDATLQVSTDAGATLTLELDSHIEAVTGSTDSGGNASLPTPTNGSGWLLVESGMGATLTNWAGEGNLSVNTNGTLQLFGWPGNASDSGLLRIEHHPSGWWELVPWSSELTHNLPRVGAGEWRIYNVESGIRIGQPLILSDGSSGNVTSLISGNGSSGQPAWGGGVTLNMTEAPLTGSPVNFTWTGSYELPADFGSALLPERSRGLASQIDLYLGDGNGVLNSTEEVAWAMFRDSLPWAESNHMVLFDESPLTGSVDLFGQSFSQLPNTPGLNEQGWSESADLTGEVGFGTTRMFSFPVRGDAIEAIPITVNLPAGWEVRYSPQIELLGGTPASFTLNRSQSPTTGMWTVTIGSNQPPVASGGLYNHTGLSIPLDGEVTLESTCTDSGIGSLTHFWEARHNGTILDSGFGLTHALVPNSTGFSHGEVMNVTLICTDWAGANSTWNGEFYVDGEPPSATISAVEDHSVVGEPLWFHDLNNESDFSLRAGSYFSAETNATDDSGAPIQVIWRSNKTEGWEYNEPWFVDQFNQGDDVNWMHMGVDERHEQRELTVYSLEMELIDEAGNSVTKGWNVTITDATPPTITAEIFVGSYPIGPLNVARPDSDITVNMSFSFDDIDAIHLLTWNVTLDGVEILKDADWPTARFFSLPQMTVGEHDLRFFAWDSKGNTRELLTNPVVHPLVPANITVLSVEVEGEAIVGEEGLLKVMVSNSGATPAVMTFCYLDQCSQNWTSGSATSQANSNTSYPLTVTSYESGPIQVVVTWTDVENGVGGEVVVDAGVSPKTKYSDTINLLFFMGIIGGAVWWLLRGKSEKTPF
jgi:hypothetical protein